MKETFFAFALLLCSFVTEAEMVEVHQYQTLENEKYAFQACMAEVKFDPGSAMNCPMDGPWDVKRAMYSRYYSSIRPIRNLPPGHIFVSRFFFKKDGGCPTGSLPNGNHECICNTGTIIDSDGQCSPVCKRTVCPNDQIADQVTCLCFPKQAKKPIRQRATRDQALHNTSRTLPHDRLNQKQ